MSRSLRRTIGLVALAALLVPFAACSSGGGGDKVPDYDLVLFHLNDRHSHWLGQLTCDYDPAAADDGTVGGAARWMKMVEDARAESQDVLLLDAGDFTMGTLLVTAEGAAGDLNLMKELGFDAAAVGNHELDWGPAGLAAMIEAADKPMVPLLAANMHFDPDDPADDALEALYGPYGEAGKYIHPWMVLERPSGIKVGLFGLLGVEAFSVSNAAPVKFSATMDEMVADAKAAVEALKAQEVDVIILLAHAGMLHADEGGYGGYTAESVELARQVEGIDAILSGHHHTVVDQGVAVPYEGADSTWSTLVMEAGRYGTTIGRWHLTRTKGVTDHSAETIPVTSGLPIDPATSDAVTTLVDDVEQNFLGAFPQVPEAGAFLDGDMFQVLTCSDFDIPRHYYENNNLGYLLADSVAEVTGAGMVAISNGGDLRETLDRCSDGCFDLSDVVIAAPLGIGPDGILGYPVVTFYITWNALKLIMEATIADMGWENNDFMLNLSGVRVEVDSSKIAYSRIQTITQYDALDESDPGTLLYQSGDPDGGWHIPSDTLIEVGVSLYIATFLEAFNLSPLDENGDKIEDAQGNIPWTDLIVRSPENQEYKLWYLLAAKLASFEQTGVPDQYNDDPAANPYGPYWRRMCDRNAGPENVSGNVCP